MKHLKIKAFPIQSNIELTHCVIECNTYNIELVGTELECEDYLINFRKRSFD
jgi:hypothetical protein